MKFYYILIEPTTRWWRIPHYALVYWVLRAVGCKEWEDELQLSPLVVNWETLLSWLRNILQFTLLQSIMIVFIAQTTWIEGYETWRGKINAISVNTLNTLKRMSLLYCYLRWRMLYLSLRSWKYLDFLLLIWCRYRISCTELLKFLKTDSLLTILLRGLRQCWVSWWCIFFFINIMVQAGCYWSRNALLLIFIFNDSYCHSVWLVLTLRQFIIVPMYVPKYPEKRVQWHRQFLLLHGVGRTSSSIEQWGMILAGGNRSNVLGGKNLCQCNFLHHKSHVNHLRVLFWDILC